MQLQRLAGFGIVAMGAVALAPLTVDADPRLGASASKIGLVVRDTGVRMPWQPMFVADPPGRIPDAETQYRPPPRAGYGNDHRRYRFNKRRYLFNDGRFGGLRYNGPPSAFAQTYYNDRTANGFDYGGRCARVQLMCDRNWRYPSPEYNGCMEHYGCRGE